MTAVISVMAPDNRGEFAAIWIPWLRSMGREPETEDLEIMADPGRYYRDAGGEAFLAKIDGKTVGTVAIKRLGDDGFEFCKLVVTQSARGSGLGPALVQTCLDFAADNGAKPLYLQSFNALDVALRIYRRMGFVDADPPNSMNVLSRTEVIMMKATAAP
jgi:GNAT superfamily N-acetyltransferase